MRLTTQLGSKLASPWAVLVTLPLLILVVGGFFVLQGERRMALALTGMTEARMDDQNRATVDQVRNILHQADEVLPGLARLGQRLIATGDETALAQALADHMRHLPGMSWLIVARPDGAFDGLSLEHSDGELRYHRARQGARQSFSITESGLELFLDQPQANYDPRQRPWYQAAISANDAVWIQPYLFSSSKTPGVSRTMAIRDAAGAVQMVVNAEVDLLTLSTYLKESESLEGARSVIVTADGELIADTGRDQQSFDNFDVLPRISDLGDATLDALMAEVAGASIKNKEHLSFLAPTAGGHETYLAGIEAIDVGSHQWLVARLVPESLALAPARRFIHIGRIVALVALVISLFLAVLFSRALVESRRMVSIARSRVDLAQQEMQQMGSYSLVRMLGEGGMGEVWLGRHQFLARPAAIKFVTMSGEFEDDEAHERFEREARAISQLRCRNTIEIYDFGTDARGQFFYAMELLDGIDLDKLIEEYGPIPPGRCVHILRQMCSSLAEAHDQGLVHRDVKPGNIFVCRQVDELDVVKVLDFGLAIRSEETVSEDQARLTRSGYINGTPEFMAPEQCMNHAVDGRADIYAIGCVAWWLLAGSEIFQGESAMDILMKHINEEPKPLSEVALQHIPPDLERIIMTCLAKNPDDRPADARQLSALLRRVDLSQETRPWRGKEALVWWEAMPSVLEDDANEETAMVLHREMGDSGFDHEFRG